MKRKKWSKPECLSVKLAPEECLIPGCKNSSSNTKKATGQGCTSGSLCSNVQGS